jgi:MoxR-like ATPase
MGDPMGDIDIQESCEALRTEIGKVIVGQSDVVDLLLITLLARGHALFQGVPGLGKTRLVRSLASATSCRFSRVQFTPDLMPGDVTGSEVLHEDRSTGARELRFAPGPVFAHLVLADEVNRATPKTQAALLEAMEERRVTAGGRTHPLPSPFHVFATQNPIEQEGTYALPEAQMDRFMFRILVDYPAADEEASMVADTTSGGSPVPDAVLRPEDLAAMQDLVRLVPAAPSVVELAVALARSTRPDEAAAEVVRTNVAWGAGPRASRFLILGAKARALLHGRDVASGEDVLALAHAVLDHRIVLNYRAEADGVCAAHVIDGCLAAHAGR